MVLLPLVQTVYNAEFGNIFVARYRFDAQYIELPLDLVLNVYFKCIF